MPGRDLRNFAGKNENTVVVKEEKVEQAEDVKPRRISAVDASKSSGGGIFTDATISPGKPAAKGEGPSLQLGLSRTHV